ADPQVPVAGLGDGAHEVLGQAVLAQPGVVSVPARRALRVGGKGGGPGATRRPRRSWRGEASNRAGPSLRRSRVLRGAISMIRLRQRSKIASSMATTRGAVIRLLVADDHPLVRQGVVAVAGREADIAVVGEAGNGREAVAQFRRLRPDVTVMDLGMPGMTGVEAMKMIRAEFPRSRFIALTVYEGDEDIHRALEAGASAYLLKSGVPAQLVDTIRAVHSGLR